MDFIKNQLAPADMVALMYPLTPVTDLRFSRNHEALARAIEKFEGRKFNYEPRTSSRNSTRTIPRRRSSASATTSRWARSRAQRSSWVACEKGEVDHLRERGFTATLPPQLNDPVAAMPGLGNTARRNPNIQNSDTTEFQFGLAAERHAGGVPLPIGRTPRSTPSTPAVSPSFEYGINEGVGLTEPIRRGSRLRWIRSGCWPTIPTAARS